MKFLKLSQKLALIASVVIGISLTSIARPILRPSSSSSSIQDGTLFSIVTANILVKRTPTHPALLFSPNNAQVNNRLQCYPHGP